MGIDRISFGLDRFKTYSLLKKWRLSDVIFIGIVLLVNTPVYYAEPFQRQFYVNDLTISHPYAVNQRVNDFMLFIYSFVVPLATIFVFTLIVADSKHKIYVFYISALGLCLSVSSTALVTNFLKNWVGRLRPDFLARCEPRENTPINVLVTAAEVCTTGHTNRLLDGFRTTPSGHSSESFSGLGYLYLWLDGQLLAENPLVGSWRKSVAILPLIGAAVIALSRTQDYRHHFVDVIVGSCLGLVIGHWCYRRNFPSIYSDVPFKPMLDDSDVVTGSNKTTGLVLSGQDEESAPLTSSSRQL